MARQRVLHHRLIFVLHQQQTNRWFVIRVAQQVINGVQIQVQLTDVARLELSGFQFNDHVTTQRQMVKQ